MKIFLILFLLLPIFSISEEVVIPKIEPGKPLPADLFIQISKKIQPSIVNISTTKKQRMRQVDIFDMLLAPNAPVPSPSLPTPHSLGSGFIIDNSGHVVTNAHVVDQADSIHIQIKDDPTIYKAKVIGRDRPTDIALLKINIKDSRTRKEFTSAELGDSNKLQVGEWVAAFGNPFGHANTMTKGIISAIDRQIDDINLLPFLQTDASINPGNSGGPLVNTQGEVVGVNTAINPYANNIGFAIPIHNVKSILKSLKNNGYVKRGFLGVRMDPNKIEFDYNGKTHRGVLIVDVVQGGPAETAGIKPYDIITEFNGTPIASSRELVKIVSATPVNEKVKGQLFRKNQMQSFTVVVAERPNNTSQAQRSSVEKVPSNMNKAPYNLGFHLAQTDASLSRRLKLPLIYAHRPIVVEVISPSHAQRAGLKVGDIVFSVNGENVQTVEDTFNRLRDARENVLYVLRFDQPGRYNLKRIVVIKK
ncbi:MAG: trypsin-like peptidase domain-containing protein [Bdellovibrionales bacterium]|nr:trypsin-like peptidase domain-containing protein [Bdellovibrionales bacterium]